MMEDERRWAINEEMRKEEEEAARRLRFAKTLKGQIAENEEQRVLEFEKRQEESRLINLNNIAWQQSEIEKLRDKEAENARVRREISEGNEQLKHFKAMEQEENRVVDLRYRGVTARGKLFFFFSSSLSYVYTFLPQDTGLSSTEDGKGGQASGRAKIGKAEEGTREDQNSDADHARARAAGISSVGIFNLIMTGERWKKKNTRHSVVYAGQHNNLRDTNRHYVPCSSFHMLLQLFYTCVLVCVCVCVCLGYPHCILFVKGQ